MGKFLIFSGENGYRFHLRSGNGETIATSEVYTNLTSCMNGIGSIRKNSAKAKVEDLLKEPGKPVTNPKFQIFRDKAGQIRFRLRARNGEVIASSQGYGSMEACLTGIESVRANAPEAEIENADE